MINNAAFYKMPNLLRQLLPNKAQPCGKLWKPAQNQYRVMPPKRKTPGLNNTVKETKTAPTTTTSTPVAQFSSDTDESPVTTARRRVAVDLTGSVQGSRGHETPVDSDEDGGASLAISTLLYRLTNRLDSDYKSRIRAWYDHVTRQIPRRTFYAVRRVLGEGGQGRAFLMERRPYSTAAPRVVGKIFAKEAHAREESQLLQEIGKHVNLVEMLDMWEYNNPIPGSSVLLLEYCDLGSLLYYKRDLHSSHEAVEEEFIWYVALSIGKALAYLHCGYGTEDYDPEDPWRRGYAIVHRDIKPENILMKTDLDAPESICVKLSDFGLASKLSLDARDNLAFNGGTYDWQPPEQVLPPHKAGPKQDMWALGAIIHYLALGEPPIDVAKADNKLKKGSEEWKRSIPRRVVCINEEPRLRQGIGNHENYDGDGAESWCQILR